ncbi:MAG: HAMP domain-containing histidine kinase [gamma proteobacterium symbiont of Bathyaustriella thionipta]|nr:HAMP domain-containing histidine kinase [gamma proteobacterium symbiont of Bathyaustriella thionipta]MCU7950406.1 HAMP domain-containing histidine kinase [gamma proteobacterium symbiont of Bathyaustriella thionipta]MCU7953657.1 HAMP domain-containing histidine kinase [gamma proteobacterium symbiont of Bathyaustriella thionipta]MCU7956908.1 HAMP domain-containing histidine kinase [gamma proteobacterium symbiont of Bathyaustriella thionipta]MCU7968167.1 HAMP domain-containing histidine kinase 
MKLKSYIFRWVTLVTLLPATALGLFATYYVQNLYYQDATDDIQHSLENISAEISRSLQADQNLILKLPESQAMQQFLPVLDEARLNEQHIDYDSKLYILSAFLRQYQSVVSLFDTFRILDIRGNTLLKIRNGRESLTRYEGFEPYAIMDKEIIQSEQLKVLSELPDQNVSFIELPQTRDEMGQENNIVIPDGVVPLNYNGQRVGYLAVAIQGANIDQVLELATRLYNGQLLIAEIDEENKVRNGQILYNDNTLLRFAALKSTVEKLQDFEQGVIWDAYQDNPFGSIKNISGNKHYYYIEYFPYPNSLTSWIVINEVQSTAFTAPFERIRTGIWMLASIAALGSLFLAHFASRAISTPIIRLAENLKIFADGEQSIAIKSSIDEIQQSSKSFNYMAKKLDEARQERIKAENLMIQSAKLASLGQMAAGIGHEINNPLNNIRSLSRLIRRDLEKDSSETHNTLLDDIRSLDEEVLRASEIVQGVLSFSRQLPEKAFSPIHLTDLLKNLEGLVKQEAKRAQVNIVGIDAIVAQDSVMILGDQGKLQQALVNILLNAIQASSLTSNQTQENNINVSLSVIAKNKGQQSLLLSIRDYGSGIDATIKDKIFDPFFTTKEVGQGTGLGLSISLGIIQNHKGQLSIENAHGGGTIVNIILPIFNTQDEISNAQNNAQRADKTIL